MTDGERMVWAATYAHQLLDVRNSTEDSVIGAWNAVLLLRQVDASVLKPEIAALLEEMRND